MGYSRSYCNTSPSIYLGLLQIAVFLLLLLPESFQAVDASQEQEPTTRAS